jgi:hypothetical protein
MNALRNSLRPMIQRNVAFMAGRRTASTALPKPPVPVSLVCASSACACVDEKQQKFSDETDEMR